MSYHGDYSAGSTVVFNFNTASFSDGSPITLGGTPALGVYKNSTTESTAGVTLTVDYDSRTGMHHVAIDTSADGTFYAAGNDFDVVITTGTVGGTSVVGRVVGSFSLANRSALRPATAGRTLVVDASGLADANAVKVGPSGSGTAQTARDLGASVLLSVGTGTGQVNLSGGKVPATLASTDVAGNVACDLQTIKTQTVTCSSAVTVEPFVGTATTAIAVDGSGHVTAGTVSDKTGYSLTVAPLDATGTANAVWDALTSAHATAGSFGVLVKTDLDATVSSRSTYAGGDTSGVTTLLSRLTQAILFDGSGYVKADVEDWKGSAAPANTGDAYARLGAPAGASIAADIAAVLAKWTTAVTESYAADGSAPTPEQALMMILQSLHEFAISGTTRTVKKLDGTTTAMTFTLDSSTAPTSTTRTT